MAAPVSHILIPGLRKAANVFIQRAVERTLDCAFVRFVDGRDEIQSDRLDAFFALERAVGGEHLAASAHNLRALAAHDVTRIAILVRDPRDALISWWHHLERADVKAARLQGLVPDTFVRAGYYALSPEEKLRSLIGPGLAALQAWMAAWLEAIDAAAGLRFYVHRFEDFAVDQRGAIRAMLAFFGHDVDPVLPEINDTRDSGIHTATHFRRGRVGSYRDEAPPDLVRLMDDQIDRRLAARLGWA